MKKHTKAHMTKQKPKPQARKNTKKSNKAVRYEVVPARPVERVLRNARDDVEGGMDENEFAERSWDQDEVQVVETSTWTDRPNQARSRLRDRRRILEVDLVHRKDPLTGRHLTQMEVVWWAANHENRTSADSPVAYKNALWNVVLDHTHWLEYEGPKAQEDHEPDRQVLVEELSRMVSSGQLDLEGDNEDEW